MTTTKMEGWEVLDTPLRADLPLSIATNTDRIQCVKHAELSWNMPINQNNKLGDS